MIRACALWFEFSPSDLLAPDVQPVGWLRLDARLSARVVPRSIRLRLDWGDGYARGPTLVLPVTRRGQVKDLVWLEPGTKGLRFAISRPPDPETEITLLRLRRIGLMERTLLRWQRVLAALWRASRRERNALALGPWRSLWNLERAYRAAARLGRQRGLSYSRWIRGYDQLRAADRARIRDDLERRQGMPPIFVILSVLGAERQALDATLAGLAGQLYQGFSVLVLDRLGLLERVSGPGLVPGSRNLRVVPSEGCTLALFELDEALRGHPGPAFVAPLRDGDVLAPHALYWMAVEACSHSNVGLLYSDEDRLSRGGMRGAPRFKPDWSPTLQRCGNYLGKLLVIEARVWLRCGGARLDAADDDGYELGLRVMEALGDRPVRHVPAVLCHRMKIPPRWIATQTRGVLEAHLRRSGIRAQVEDSAAGFRVRYALTRHPVVSVLIPTRDGAALLSRCLAGVLERTRYTRLEVLVVDNGSSQADALGLLEEIARDPRVRVLRDPRAFNFSALNNLAVREARGDVLCLLNNDTDVMGSDWLEELLGHLLQDRVGAVGAKLLYPDGRVQHGGDLLGRDGIGRHLHTLLEGDAPGYCGRALLAQELSAVTAACLLTWRYLYLRLGGLDERNLPVAYNDLDYCLRLRQAGYRVVWTPHAELYHWEKVSRGADGSPGKAQRARRELAYMRRRWSSFAGSDPYYNPNLDDVRADFSLALDPRVRRPWL